MPDHRFIRTSKTPDGEMIVNNGAWTFKNRGLDVGDYSFFIDTETDKALSETVKSYSFPFAMYAETLICDWGSRFYKLRNSAGITCVIFVR